MVLLFLNLFSLLNNTALLSSSESKVINSKGMFTTFPAFIVLYFSTRLKPILGNFLTNAFSSSSRRPMRLHLLSESFSFLVTTQNSLKTVSNDIEMSTGPFYIFIQPKSKSVSRKAKFSSSFIVLVDIKSS